MSLGILVPADENYIATRRKALGNGIDTVSGRDDSRAALVKSDDPYGSRNGQPTPTRVGLSGNRPQS